MLDYKFIRTLRTIQSHGSFSKPFLNANLSSFVKEERAFIMAVKYEYDSDRRKALREIKDGLRNCRDKNLKYLLMMKFLELARALGKREQANAVYQKLRNSLSDISPSVRDSIIDELIGHCVFTEKDADCVGRFKKEKRTMESSAMVFFEVNIGRKLVRSGDMNGLENFRRAIGIAVEVFHPPGIITAMNALGWYGRDHDAEEALKAGKDALYSAGLYFEGMSILYVFDTVMNAAKKRETRRFRRWPGISRRFTGSLRKISGRNTRRRRNLPTKFSARRSIRQTERREGF